MPDHLKDQPDSPEFSEYLKGFLKRRERNHRSKVFREIVATASLMIAE